MDFNQRKLILIGLSVACLGFAVAVFYFNHSSGDDVLNSLAGQGMWVLCSNSKCAASYEVDTKAYFEFVKENSNPAALGAPPMVCDKCAEKSVYAAEKCSKCGNVFFPNSVAGDFADRCPKCKYSKTEDIRNSGR